MRRALRLVSRSRLRPGQRALDPSPPLSDRTSPRRPRAPRIAVGGLGLRFGRGLIAAALECRRHRPWRARGGEGEERQDQAPRRAAHAHPHVLPDLPRTRHARSSCAHNRCTHDDQQLVCRSCFGRL